MVYEHRRLRWAARRAKAHPLLLVVGISCVAAVLVEVGAFTGFFGLGGLGSGTGPRTPPNLNPHHDLILAVTGNITYFGSITGYFPALQGASLCGQACPEVPRLWSSDGILPEEVGVYFYYNVTNLASVDVNLSVPVVTTSGPVPTLFFLQTWCCYTPATVKYDEMLDSPIQFPPGLDFGLEGYAYTTVSLPATPAGGFTLSVNFTSN